MSKGILGLVIVAAAIAIPFVAPEIAGALGLASALGVSAATATAIVVGALEIGLAVANSMLLGPGNINRLKTNPTDRLHATLDTVAPRKIVFGYTALATDIRYQTFTGTKQSYYEMVIAAASHKIGDMLELWIDNVKAGTLASGSLTVTSSTYTSYLSGSYSNMGVSGGGHAIDSTWTANCSLTQCAWMWLQFNLVGPNNSTPSPFQGGVSSRLTIRGHGAYVYDPRLDDTAGGSGTMRATDNSTWDDYTWDQNRCENTALCLLFYLLGWKSLIDGKLMVGMGIPAARIDLPSFIIAANICDEAVSLKAGGTEPRYRAAGVVSEADDRSAVIDTLCSSMNATLRDAGGKISIQILHDDLATPVMDFGLDDIIGNEEWDQTPALTDYKNVVRGKCIDASDNSLYQMTDYPQQAVSSPDGIDRIDSFDFPLVESQTQAQRLAKMRLMRSQFQGKYSATFGPRAWAVSMGDVVRLTHSGLNFSNKLFRVVSQQLTQLGQVKLTLLEEDSSIYAWNPSTDEQTGLTAGLPTVADPINNPLIPVDYGSILRSSYPTGLSVTANDIGSGSGANISLSACTIQYDTTPASSAAWPAGSISPLAYSSLYYLYADVPEVGSNSPNYGATTTYSDALNSTNHPLRIFLNQSITTPAGGGTGTTGGGTGGGYGGGGEIP